jgi:hypothetical protein
MVFDLELVENAFGPSEGFSMIIKDSNGDPDNLTIYPTVRMTISDMLFTSPPVRNHTQADDELTVDAEGGLLYLPTNANKVPPAGKYYVQVYRDSSTTSSKPIMKFSLLVTRGVPKA